MSNNIKSLIRKLISDLNNWAKEYYIDDKPSISDQEYDAIYNQLLNLEKEYPKYVFSDSPTQRVGHFVDNRFEKVKHNFPMLSLGNAYNDEDLLDFDKQIKRELNIKEDIEYVTELKIDGISISLLYNKGILVKAITRGDGNVGEDVTHNVLKIKDIPHEIPFENEVEFRGEIYMRYDVLNELNKNGDKLANTRNAAAGTLRQLDSSIAEKRKLSSFIYAIPNPLKYNLTTHTSVLNFIKNQGLNTNKETKLASNILEVIENISYHTKSRESLEYEIDGVVIKVNNILLWEDIGFTIKAPKYMIAYKFPEEIGQSELVAIFPTIGRTGRVTYNARLKPLRLAGTTITAATLHNADYIREININVGDIVKVKKAAEIIPKVLGVAKKNNNNLWEESLFCPACEHLLKRYDSEVDQYCINKECPQRNIAILEHFTSRKAMDIEHLSTETILLFVNEGLITNIPSIFELASKKDEILSLPGFKEKSVTNILNAIEKAKKQDLGKFIFALGIRHVGEKLANSLAKRFGSLEAIIKASKKEIESIRDFGSRVSESIFSYFSDEANIKILNSLLNHGINFHELKGPSSNLLNGLNFVITGVLSQNRDYYKDLIEANGGNVSSVVSKNTSYLLAGLNSGSKMDKALELNIKIINEEDLGKLIKGEQNE